MASLKRLPLMAVVLCVLSVSCNSCAKRDKDGDAGSVVSRTPGAGAGKDETGRFDVLPGGAGVPVVGRDVPMSGDMVELSRYFEPGAGGPGAAGAGADRGEPGNGARGPGAFRGMGGDDGSAPVADIFRTIHFDFDSYRLTPEAEKVLQAIGGYLLEHENIALVIEGHCDERGAETYNLALGEKRALAVREFLVAMGVDPARIHTVSFGEERPVDPGHDEEAYARNRRAEFRISVR